MTEVQSARERRGGVTGASRGRRSLSGLAAAAWAGIVGPIVFTATFLVQEVYRGDEYDRMSEVVSALEAGPHGWVQQVNFVVFGLLTVGFAIGLHRGLRRTRGGLVGPALLVVSGLGSLISGLFPLREDAAGVTYDPGGHVVGGFTFFLASALALLALAPRLRRDPAWRSLAPWTLAAGVAAVAGFVVNGALVIPDDAPLHDWAGLAQRTLVLLVLFPCRIALASRLLRVARWGPAERT
jgi:hypothetical membrane protein